MNRLKEIAALLGSPLPEGIDGAIKNFCVDSREVIQGSLFFALAGENADGHDFLEEAARKGACACIVRQDWKESQFFPCLLIRVPDVLRALQKLAKHWFRKCNVPTIALTGSVGKTTTKGFIRTILEGYFKTTAARKNYNSQVGLPLTLLNDLKGDEDWLVLEMAMTHAGNIRDLVQIAPPDFALINTIALVHAMNFSSLEEIAKAKAEIFSHPKTSWGLIPASMSLPESLSSSPGRAMFTFSKEGGGGDYSYSIDGEEVHLITPDRKTFRFSNFPFPGKHLRHDFVCAAILANRIGLSWEEIQSRVPLLAMPPNRFQFVEMQGIRFLNDSYNASEASVTAALETIGEIPAQGKKFAILGSMMELGAFSEECHRRVGELALQCVDRMYCFGEECEPIRRVWEQNGREAPLFLDKHELMRELKQAIGPGDFVLVKGSLSKGMREILDLWETATAKSS